MRLKSAIFSVIISAQAFALSQPQPIRGNPASATLGKVFTRTSGDTEYKFSIPRGWGLGKTTVKQNRATFTFFPESGGVGCRVTVTQHEDEDTAKERALNIKKSFSKTVGNSLSFEARFKKGWYACRVEDNYLVETWYVLSQISGNKEMASWKKLKECVTVSSLDDSVSDSFINSESLLDVSCQYKDESRFESSTPFIGWVGAHPTKPLQILFKNNFNHLTKVNKDPSKSYILEVGDADGTGFFYIMWDPENLDTSLPYEAHLKEMVNDIEALGQEKEVWFDEAIFNPEEGWAMRKGLPYTLVSLKGNGFLYGFALKSKQLFRGYDFDDFINRVTVVDLK